jgi:hypothetical protein
MQVSVGDQIRVTAGFREGKNVFKTWKGAPQKPKHALADSAPESR